ncbi:MAG: 16S rRNA (adenine(1518)-N(6)/adenine(1519)-N(6))-dimethyltransferase RsmA [Alphaproteobacteria bacterium]|nr:16S rRNA (adenine(1518)-N(6)/adenine(1519)-N(6))-dimethyltransferase RsmA [Alphaproteobacteria bacterium]
MIFTKTLRQTVEEHGLMAKKALGQNFLLDQNVTDKIIRLSLEKQSLKDLSNFDVLEIGPGPGGLTRAVLAQKPKSLTVIEMDERCIEIMNELKLTAPCPMEILNADALKFDIAHLKPQKLQIVSNLPYNISVPLLTGWLQNTDKIEAMTLMFQKEVADRICAPIKTKDYGRLSVLAQLVCDVQRLWTLNPECFVPAPKVQSTVLLFKPLKNRPTNDVLQKVEKLTMAAFSQRRKMIRQSLKNVKDLENLCLKAGVSLTARAEEITPQQYLLMAMG